MSNPSEAFECRWQPSRRLLTLYLSVMVLALLAPWLADVPLWSKLLSLAVCLAHAAWVLPRHVLLTAPRAVTGLRRDASGWHLYSTAAGWQAVQLRPDSLALPLAVVLRYRLPGQRLSRGVCIPRDALAPEQHRRLRLRLKFSRRRWAEPGAVASE
ncbi:protein YgfX [Ectopseudomonas composti]|uniref:protein YgfX n=1 Tax=Ectopseudomonas composti TaxID=658457 RepID=UPI000944D6A9|nr:protein YgfX [Pseudomonas composti]